MIFEQKSKAVPDGAAHLRIQPTGGNLLDVTETVQNYKNNKPHGKATVKNYQTEEVVK